MDGMVETILAPQPYRTLWEPEHMDKTLSLVLHQHLTWFQRRLDLEAIFRMKLREVYRAAMKASELENERSTWSEGIRYWRHLEGISVTQMNVMQYTTEFGSRAIYGSEKCRRIDDGCENLLVITNVHMVSNSECVFSTHCVQNWHMFDQLVARFTISGCRVIEFQNAGSCWTSSSVVRASYIHVIRNCFNFFTFNFLQYLLESDEGRWLWMKASIIRYNLLPERTEMKETHICLVRN